jgi:hypothetical protein
MLKTLKRSVRVVWVFRKTQWAAMFSADLTLSVIQIIEYYGARWKIEIYQPCCLRKSVYKKLLNFIHGLMPIYVERSAVGVIALTGQRQQ